ncbi:helix-turn-helix domain-containing protein [Desulfobacter postgatei]|uniref:helix-turn-helix domain-containing protein n=1 Tax=Desulfobacter postgatei TaxID=2293 RepID=UPI001FDF2CCF|nr:helix-turn-helix domain-containing protein [Desulfobacter postgatei]
MGKYQFDSLIDKPRSGRTPLIHSEMHDEVIDIVKKNPRQLKSAITEIQEKFGKKVSVKTLKLDDPVFGIRQCHNIGKCKGWSSRWYNTNYSS